MSIEIQVEHLDKPYVFGAILNRDETFDNIVSHGRAVGYPWALEASQFTGSKPRKEAKRKRKETGKMGQSHSDDEGGHSDKENKSDSEEADNISQGSGEVRQRISMLRMSDLRDDLDDASYIGPLT